MDSFDKPHGPDRLNSPEPERQEPVPAAPDEPDDSQLPPSAWLVRNGTYLVIFAALIAILFYKFGLDGTLNLLKVGLGLGLVIFIHELGHFAVAKWCNVYVETFSIGFGPALPGCRVKYGETVYKLALFPLGGYVKMLGEGEGGEGEDEEHEKNPRSYKNKTVGQRMAIISAGVIMNVILGCLCFIAVYTNGKRREAPIVGGVETASPAWQSGLVSSAVLVQVGNRVATPNRPLSFDNDLRRFMAVSNPGEKVKIAYELYEPIGDPKAKPKRYEIEIAPRKTASDQQPVVGLRPVESLALPKEGMLPADRKPYHLHTTAAAVREPLPLQAGDVVVATSDPDDPTKLRPLPEGDLRTFELSQRYRAFAGQRMEVSIRRASGKEETLESKPAEFLVGDVIIGSTDPGKGGAVTLLPADPRNPGGKLGDYFEFQKRLQLSGGQFFTVRVQRDKGGPEVDLVMPPAWHYRLPVRMRMGQVVALRDPIGPDDKVPAREADVQPEDIIDEVILTADTGKRTFVISGSAEGADAELIDPLRLPDALTAWAWAHPETRVSFKVRRDDRQHERKPVLLDRKVPWDYAERWRFTNESPFGVRAPISIPALGLTYRVDPMVEEVEGGSAGLQKNDVLKRYWSADPDTNKNGEWRTVEPGGWAHVFQAIQELAEAGPIKLEVERGGVVTPIELIVKPDGTWPRHDFGVILMIDTRTQQADNVGEAMLMGLQDTRDWIFYIVLSLKQIIVGNISYTQMGGPVSIGVTAYNFAGLGFWEFVFFIGLISVNLAVINFLPVPFLDGGHMMFLLYEKIRGKPAPETVQTVATLGGVLFLISVMVFVFYLDFMRVLKWFF